jgi:hypothetical protein
MSLSCVRLTRSFRDSNGEFPEPAYTVPSNDDGEVEDE